MVQSTIMNIGERFSGIVTKKKDSPTIQFNQELTEAIVWTMITEFFDKHSEKIVDSVDRHLNWVSTQKPEDDGEILDISNAFIQYLGGSYDGFDGTYEDFRRKFLEICERYKIDSPISFYSEKPLFESKEKHRIKKVSTENTVRGIISNQLKTYFKIKHEEKHQTIEELLTLSSSK